MEAYNRGVWAIGMVETTERRRIIVIRVGRINAETLLPLIISHVNYNSTMYTDLWKPIIICISI